MKKKKILNSISRFATVLLVLCIIPSGVFAFENDQKFGPAQKINDENFTEAKAGILDSISKQIAELQSFYTSVNKASNASELQSVLFSHHPANGCRPEGMNREDQGMHHGFGRLPGLFNLGQVENATDDNYTAVQTEIVNSIANVTGILKGQVNNTTDENMTGIVNKQITELESLSTNVSEASNAAELQNVVLTYMKTQAVDSIEKKIAHIEARANESKNATNDIDENVTELNSRITELRSLKDKINSTESLKEFKEIVSSFYGMPGKSPEMCFGGNQIRHRGDFPMGPGRMPENNAEV